MDVSGGLSRVLQLASKYELLKDNDAERAPIQNALAAIEGAILLIDQIRCKIDQAYDITFAAKDSKDRSARAQLAESYDDLRQMILDLVTSPVNEHCPLVGKERRNIDLQIGERTCYSIIPMYLDTPDRGLSLSVPRNAFRDDEDIHKTLEELDRYLIKTDRIASNYRRDAEFLIARLQMKG